MKNILGTIEDLQLFNKEGKKIYEYNRYSDSYSCESTYDSSGNILTCKNSDGYSAEYIRDLNGNVLTYKNSNGFSFESTYDSDGKELTYKNSEGVIRGFDILEYTIKELLEKLGNFKIKK